MEPTKDMFLKTITRGDREVDVPAGYKGNNFLDQWALENVEERAELYGQEGMREARERKEAIKKEKRERKIAARQAKREGKRAEAALDESKAT